MWVTRLLRRTSKVPTRDVVPAAALVYSPRYAVPRRMTLSTTFDVVTEKNRYTSLQILLERLSGYVGRRQYKMMYNLRPHLETLQAVGIDWHEIKALSREDLQWLCDEVLFLSAAERSVFLTAVEAKLCGVLRRSETRHSTFICMNTGCIEHGWRCGVMGHTNDVYFEGKPRANPGVIQLHQRASLRRIDEDGVEVEVRTAPNFSIVGRLQHSEHPRVWSAPTNPTFEVSVIGFEFRIHPDDPRVAPQVVAAAAEWEMHAAVVKQVLWELLETRAVERESQALDMVPGDLGPPDSPSQYSSAFTTRVRRERGNANPPEPPASAAVGDGGDGAIAPNDVFVEQRFVDSMGVQQPWFREPLPQRFVGGVPSILPFAPSVIIRATFRQVERESPHEDLTQKLVQPVMDVACLVHPEACFWWDEAEENRCLQQLADYAKRIPFAVPFNLYLRVDPSRADRANPSRREERLRRQQEKESFFDLRRFPKVHCQSPSADSSSRTVHTVHAEECPESSFR